MGNNRRYKVTKKESSKIGWHKTEETGVHDWEGREEEARKLLRWGQQNFTTVQILHRGKKVGTERIWYGDKENIDLGTEQEFWMVLPKAEIPHIKAKYTLDGR